MADVQPSQPSKQAPEQALRLLPNLLMPGVNKCGTSSLAWYLGQHPEICLGDRKEINYFLPMRYDQPLRESLEDYGRHFSAYAGETYRLDASPGYCYGGARIADAVRRTLPEPRIVMILRNPVDRFWSSYRSKRDRAKIDPATEFRTFFEACRTLDASGQDHLRQYHHYRALSIGRYADVLEPWFDAFGQRVTIVFFEHLVTEPQRAVADVCVALGLDGTIAKDFNYAVRNVTVNPRSRAVSAFVRRVNLRVDRHFRAYPRTKQVLRVAYKAVNGSNRREVLSPEDRAAVEEFYAPANKRLFEQLTSRGYVHFPAWLAKAV